MNTVIHTKDLNAYYGGNQVLKNITVDIPRERITAIVGPSGCGKSTFLRCINRMNDFIEGFRISGEIFFDEKDIYSISPVVLRKQIGMVFQKPNPFPKSVYNNVAFGPRIHGIKDKSTLDRIVKESLEKAALWDEVKDKLNENAFSLSGGQQQRLCIARALAVEPEVILLDEPCSALDPISTTKIEDLLTELKKTYTIILVTHNMQQAARVGDYAAFFLMGEVIEYSDTETMFETPKDKRTEDYITGRFG